MSRNIDKGPSKSFSLPYKIFFFYNVGQEDGYSKIIFISQFYEDK